MSETLLPAPRPGHPEAQVSSGAAEAVFGLPTGAVTFLLTDIVGSTRLWKTAPVAMAGALAVHDPSSRRPSRATAAPSSNAG